MLDNQVKNFELTKRRALIVWIYSFRQLKTLKKFGAILYASHKMKYVVLYMDECDVEEKEKAIRKLHFVREVERSYRPDVALNFAEKIGTPAAFQPEGMFEVAESKTEIRLAEHL